MLWYWIAHLVQICDSVSVLAQQDGDSTTSTSSSDDGDGSLELELLRSLARRVLGVTAVEDRLAQMEASQVLDAWRSLDIVRSADDMFRVAC